MSPTAPISVDEYLKLSIKPYCEYIDGFLRQKAWATTDHARAQFRVCVLLQEPGYEAYPEVTVRISPTKYLIPDISVSRDLEDPYPTTPILLAIEILSPDDRLGATLAKCEEYHAWGTPYCWVIDPESKPLGNITKAASRCGWNRTARCTPAKLKSRWPSYSLELSRMIPRTLCNPVK
jgi:Uma2 family endonuclease